MVWLNHGVSGLARRGPARYAASMAAREQAKKNLIVKFGPFWSKNEENFRKLRVEAEGFSGVYLLYCGWFPIYVGCGELLTRISGHKGSKSKIANRFAWFAVAEKRHCRELEAIFLRSLPYFLRLNNKQGAHLPVGSTGTPHRIPIKSPCPKCFLEGSESGNNGPARLL